MLLLGRDKLNCLQDRNKKLDKWLTAWAYELFHARWWCTNDVLKQFPKAQDCSNDLQEGSNGLFLFQTEPRGYCIEVLIAFPQGVALITDLTELVEDNNEQH